MIILQEQQIIMPENKHFIAGQKEYEKGDYRSAIAKFTLAIEEDPDNAYIYCERGIAWFHLWENSKSLADMNQAQKLQPENPYRYSSRAYIREKMGDIRGAIEDYRKTLEIDPEDAVAWNNLGILEEKLGFEELAKSRFKKADELADTGNFSADPGREAEPEKTIAKKQRVTEEKTSGVLAYLKIMAGVFSSERNFRDFLQFITGKKKQ